MVIGYYGRALANEAGIGRYTRELLRALIAEPRSHRFRVFVGPTVARQYSDLLGDSMVVLSGHEHRFAQEQILLPSALRREKVDLFHCPDFTLPWGLPRSVPAICTVHDLAFRRFPASNSVRSQMLFRVLAPGSIKRASAVISVSEYTKSEVVSAYRTPADKITVIPNAVDSRFARASARDESAIRERNRLPGRFVLYLGAIEPRKNIERLAEAVAAIPSACLVLAGAHNRNAEAILSVIRKKLGERVRVLGFVEDDDLQALYTAATVFAYPSLYEGFGIPPLEAMACGTAVACSNTTSLPEVVGSAACTFDPTSTEDMTAQIRSLWESEELRDRLSAAGSERAKQFTWSKVASQTLDLYERVTR